MPPASVDRWDAAGRPLAEEFGLREPVAGSLAATVAPGAPGHPGL